MITSDGGTIHFRRATSAKSLLSAKDGGNSVLHKFEIKIIDRNDIPRLHTGSRGVLLVTRGRGIFCCGEKRFEAKPGDIFILAANQYLELSGQDSADFEAILVRWVVHFSLLTPAMKALDLPASEGMRKVEGDEEELKAAGLIIRAMQSEKMLSATQNHLILPGLFQSLALVVDRQILQARSGTRIDPIETSRKRLQNVLDQIANNVAENPDWAQMAKSMGFTERYFRKFFTKAMGCSPVHYLLQSRVLRSEARILSSERSISEICYEVGFQSISAFNSIFRKYNGSYPSYVRSVAKSGLSIDQQVQNIEFNNSMRSCWSLPYPSLQSSSPAKWRKLELRPFCNRPVRLTGGLFGGPLFLKHLPVGETCYHGIPFDLLEETGALPNASIVMRSQTFRGSERKPVPARLKIALPARIRSLYVLHACAWAKDPVPFASYSLEYKQGKPVRVNLSPKGLQHGLCDSEMEKSNIQDWWPSYEQVPRLHARPVVVESPDNAKEIRFLYTIEIVNPTPDRPISALTISSSRALEATLVIFAITALL